MRNEFSILKILLLMKLIFFYGITGYVKRYYADNPDTIKYDTRVLKPNLCDYAEAYILVDGTIRATNAVNATRLALKICAPFTKCNLEINDTCRYSRKFRYSNAYV